jgi:multiple sugar transport system permease protein
MKSIRAIFLFIIGLGIVLWSIGPIIWMGVASLRERRELLLEPDRIIPSNITLESYSSLFSQQDFIGSILRSGGVAFACTLVTLILAATASYAAARYRIRGLGLVRNSGIWAYLFPPVVIVIPFYILMKILSLQNAITGLLLAHISFCFPFAIWLLYPFIRSLPMGLEEAASADGATPLQALRYVVLPVAWPGILAVAAFCFSLSWSDYLFARVLLGSDNKTLPVYIYDLYTGTVINWGVLMACGTMSVLPVALLVGVAHRQLTSGFATAGIRG